MTKLQQAAMTAEVMRREEVEAIYSGWSYWTLRRAFAALAAVCESHERLRMELEGAEKLLAHMKDGRKVVLLDCGCEVTDGWRCPVHGQP